MIARFTAFHFEDRHASEVWFSRLAWALEGTPRERAKGGPSNCISKAVGVLEGSRRALLLLVTCGSSPSSCLKSDAICMDE